MEQKSKRKLIILVFAFSMLISLIFSVVFANSLPAEPIEPIPTINVIMPSATPVPSGEVPDKTHNVKPSNIIHSNPPYSKDYSTKWPSMTSSIVTPTPVFEDGILNNYSVKLVSFDEDIATYEVTVNFNKDGAVKMIATESDRKLTEADMSPEYIRTNIFQNKEYTFLSSPQSWAEGNVKANKESVFTLVTAVNDRVDLFFIIDGEHELDRMVGTIKRSNQGGIPEIKESSIFPNSNITVNELGQIKFDVETTMETKIKVNIVKSGNLLYSTIKDTNALKASITIDNASEYENASIEVCIVHKDVTSTNKWIITNFFKAIQS